jgi:NADH:ubiquinone oxidoreductase subunit K
MRESIYSPRFCSVFFNMLLLFVSLFGVLTRKHCILYLTDNALLVCGGNPQSVAVVSSRYHDNDQLVSEHICLATSAHSIVCCLLD